MNKNKGLVFMGIGFELAGLVLAALIIGEKLDKHYNKDGIFVVILLMASLISWTWHLIFLVRKMDDNDPDKI